MPQTIAPPAPGHTDISRVAVTLLAIAQVIASALPGLGVGTPIGEQSDEVWTLITPAGWAFSIWGVLYLGSFLFAIFQALPSQRDNALLAELRWPAAGVFLANAFWATYVQLGSLDFLSVAVILFGLVSALLAYRRIADWPPPFSAGERWFAVIPLSAFAAWLSAAAIVNIAAALRFHGIDADAASAPLIASAVVVAGGAIAGLALARGHGNPVFALVFLWALAGIFAAGGQGEQFVALAAGAAALITVIGSAIGLRSRGLGYWFPICR